MKNSVRHEITSKYSSELIGKSKDNLVVDVSQSIVGYLKRLPKYEAPPVQKINVVIYDAHGHKIIK